MTRVNGRNPGFGYKQQPETTKTSGSKKKSKSIREGEGLGPGRHFGRRMVADWITSSIIFNILSQSNGSNEVLLIAIAWTFWILSDVVCLGLTGTTPAKWLLRLGVQGVGGERPTWIQVLTRFAMKGSPALVASGAFIAAEGFGVFTGGTLPRVLASFAGALQLVIVVGMLTDDDTRGVHDHSARTQVTRTR